MLWYHLEDTDFFKTCTAIMSAKKGLLERLAEGPVVGDGSMIFTLEKRGYVAAGHWTPEVVMEYPDAVRQLCREYLRAGADVIQSCTYSSPSEHLSGKTSYKTQDINNAACDIAFDVANSGNAMVCGSIPPTKSFKQGEGKEKVQAEIRRQVEIFMSRKVDFLIAEFFSNIIEAEYAVEIIKDLGVPVAITMTIGPTGDLDDVPPAECGVRMGKTGADVIGLNCRFDPQTCIETIKLMKAALDKEGLKPYLMLQALGYHAPDASHHKYGASELPEWPLAMEPRAITRWEARRYAREAYNAGVRYIGGCCGFEPHHIREIAEELAGERGKRPPGQDKNGEYGSSMKKASQPFLRERHGKGYWMNLPSVANISQAFET